jgi:hypothetical protein
MQGDGVRVPKPDQNIKRPEGCRKLSIRRLIPGAIFCMYSARYCTLQYSKYYNNRHLHSLYNVLPNLVCPQCVLRNANLRTEKKSLREPC